MDQDRSEYPKFMEDVQAFRGEGWDDHPDFKELCKQYAQSQLRPVSQSQFEPVFDYAWQQGHSNGYEEVASIFDDLLTCIKPFRKHSDLL